MNNTTHTTRFQTSLLEWVQSHDWGCDATLAFGYIIDCSDSYVTREGTVIEAKATFTADRDGLSKIRAWAGY